MIKRENIKKDIIIILALFLIIITYVFFINGSLDINIIINIIYLLSSFVYLSSFIVLLQINSIYVSNLYRCLAVSFASIGIISMSYSVFFKNDLLVMQNSKVAEIFYIFSMYEAAMLIFSFLNINRNMSLKNILKILIPITFLMAFISINENVHIYQDLTMVSKVLYRSVVIILYYYLYKIIKKNKKNITETSYQYFNIYLILRIAIGIFSVLSGNLDYLLRFIISYILRFLGSYCIFKIIVIEVIISQHKTLYTKLISKSNDLEKYIQELERRNMEDDIKNQLLSNISHEFKTPVNVIYSAIQMQNLKRDSNDINEVIKYNDIIKQNCHRLTRLINNFIDSSKLRGGEYNTDFKCINIVEVVENTTMSILSFAEIANINVVFDTDDEELYVLADRDLIERVILNLLSNAIKYNKQYGDIFVNIKSTKNTIEIKIEDSGVGISKEKQEVIFNRFERADKSLSRHKEGSGLGLSIVKEIILKHNGKICIDSKEGIGTMVLITLRRIEYNKDLFEINNSNNEIGNGIKEKVEIEMSDIYF